MDRRLSPRYFDATKPLVTAKHTTINGVDHSAGDLINPDEVEQGTRLRMWLVGRAKYQDDYRPTEVIDPAEEAKTLVTVEQSGGGWFLILAPWLSEPIKVQGKEAAEARADELRERGDTKGVEVTGGAGGWFEVTAPWLAESEKIQGEEAANARADELIVQGPPPAAPAAQDSDGGVTLTGTAPVVDQASTTAPAAVVPPVGDADGNDGA